MVRPRAVAVIWEVLEDPGPARVALTRVRVLEARRQKRRAIERQRADANRAFWRR